MGKFNQQFATQHLREEFKANIAFTIDNEYADAVFTELISSGQITNLAPDNADYLELSNKDWQTFQEAIPSKVDFDSAVTQIDGMYEDGTATGGEAYKPGLDVPAKKYKAPYTETKTIPRDWKNNPSIPNRPSTGGYIYKQLFEEEDLLKESYSQFKNKTKTRGKSDQFHQAVREVKRRVEEINKLFEYVGKLKGELSEGEGGLKYKMHTEKALGKIKHMVFELNKSIRKFK